MMTNSFRYYLEATEPVNVGGQRYQPGDFIRTAKDRARSFATLEKAIAWKHKNIGPKDFPVRPVPHQASLPKTQNKRR